VNILSELTALLSGLGVNVETGIFSDTAADEYVVITPLTDSFNLFGDNRPEFETQEVRLSLYSKSNYLELKNRFIKALLNADFTITERLYIEHEDDTGYHHYAIDTVKLYALEE
jgi:hypothetical protein